MSSFAPFDYSSLNCPSQQMLSPPAVPDPSPPPTYSQVEHAVQSIIWQKETSDGSLAPAYESYPYASAVSSPSSDGGAAFPAVAPSTSGSFAHSPHVTAGDLVGSLSHSPSGLSSSDANSQQGSVAAGLPTAAENVKPFISKLWALLNDPDHYRDCLVWDHTGTSFIISQANERLLQTVLPKAFGHANLSSFTRQLNIYSFKRLPLPELFDKLDLEPYADTTGYSGWSNPLFRRDDRSRRATMAPRPSRARLAKKVEKEERRRASIA